MKKYTIRELREKKLQISQEKLAHLMGLTASTMCHKENYKRNLNAYELLKLAELADVDPRQIILK